MIVYVVVYIEDYDYPRVYGVYSTLKKAEDAQSDCSWYSEIVQTTVL